MSEREKNILGRLYDEISEDHPDPGRVLITSPSAGESSAGLNRLREDLTEVLAKSGFTADQSPNRDQVYVAEAVLGRQSPLTGAPSIYAGYDGWSLSVSNELNEAVPGPGAFNPISSLLTASIAASEAFRIRFGNELGLALRARMNPGLIFGLHDSAQPFPKSLDFGGKVLSWFGSGSIAFAACFALRGIDLSGAKFHIVDNDAIKAKNIEKYLGLSPRDLGKAKAVTLGEKIASLGGASETYKLSLNAYSRKMDFQVPFAIVSTDTSVSRRDMQAKLPKVVVNAWTGNDSTMMQAGAYRYEMSQGGACLMCQYWDDVEGHPDMVELANKSKIDPLIYAEAIRENELLRWKNVPGNAQGLKFAEGYRAMCDALQITTGNLRREFAVPFISGIGGALLALILVLEGSEISRTAGPLHDQLRFVLSSESSSLFVDPPMRRSGCICTDPIYTQAYAQKWGGSTSL
jgi:hypothetical protein